MLKVLATLTDQIHILQTFTDNPMNCFQKPLGIGVFPFVETEGLLVEVTKEVKRFDIEISDAEVENIKTYGEALAALTAKLKTA